MNHTAGDMKLFAHLTLTPHNLIMLVFGIATTLIATAGVSGWQKVFFTVFVVTYLLICSPDFRDYQPLNLSRSHWVRHKQLLVSIYALLLLTVSLLVPVLTPAEPHWILVFGIVAVLTYRLFRRPAPADPWQEKLLDRARGRETTENPRLPMTPINQIIRGPQLKTWLATGLPLLLVMITVDLLGGLFDDRDPLRNTIVAVVVGLLSTGAVMKTTDQSLRHWVHFGGTRIRWARETALLGLFGPAVVTLFGSLYYLLVGSEGAVAMMATLLSVALVLPVLAITAELAKPGRTRWIAFLLLGTSVLLTAAYLRGGLGGITVITLLLLQYLVFTLLLPALTRGHVLYSGGVREWFGIRAGDIRS